MKGGIFMFAVLTMFITINHYFWFIMKRILFFLVIGLISTTGVLANAVVYDDGSGLSNSSITFLCKDNRGMMWVGTENGLNTFDGYNFNEIEALKGEKVNHLLFVELRNELWVTTDNGVFIIDAWQQKLKRHEFSVTKDNNVMCTQLVNNQLYLIFFSGKIFRVDGEYQFRLVMDLKASSYISNGLNRCAYVRGETIVLNPIDAKALVEVNLLTANVKANLSIPIGEVWDLTTQGYVLRRPSGMLNLDGTTIPFASSYSFGVAVWHNRTLYASLKGRYGLYKITNKPEPLVSDELVFKSKIITQVFFDDSHVIWVGTNKGLIKLNERTTQPFATILEGGSPLVSCRQILDGNADNLYLATYNGIFEYNKQTGKVELFDPKKQDEHFPLYTRALLLKGNYLYAGTESNNYYFYRYNKQIKRYESGFYKLLPEGAQISSVYGMTEDASGLIWLATDRGLAVYNDRNQTLTLQTSGKFNVGNTRLFYIKRAAQGNAFWVAGHNTVLLVDAVQGVKKVFNAAINQSVGLPQDDYIFVDEHPGGQVWAGTKKSGVVIINPNDGNVAIINRSNGLSHNEVYGVLWYRNNFAWISTKNGLCKYNMATGVFTNYFVEEGLSDNEFNQNSLLRDEKGTFYFGGLNGVNYFSPAAFKEEEGEVDIFTGSVSYWNKSFQKFTQVVSGANIVLSPDDHLLTFSFGLSDYSHTESNTFFYRIKGVYNHWVSLGNQNILRLESLNAGDYEVEIIGFNKRGRKSKQALVFHVVIQQVFYKVWWFYVLTALLVILLVYAYFKWRLRNVHQKQRLRTQIASNLHDEVGSLLTSIIISTDAARYSVQTVSEKDDKLERIASLSRNATSTMSDVLWSIDARNDYAGNLTDRMREHAEAMLLPADIDVEFDFTETRQEQNIHPDTRQQLYLIFKEAVNNVVKHSEATLVKVFYKQQGAHFELRITNNNHQETTEENNPSRGQGLKNMQMRAGRIHAQCIISTRHGHFEVKIVK